jgi:hypothetical protein
VSDADAPLFPNTRVPGLHCSFLDAHETTRVRPDEAWLCPACREWWNDPLAEGRAQCGNRDCEAMVERRGDTLVWLWRRCPPDVGCVQKWEQRPRRDDG